MSWKWMKARWVRDSLIVGKVVMLVSLPTALLLVHVWNQYRITDMGYQIAQVTGEHRHLMEENKKLAVEAQLQGRSDRVAEMAREQFGLVQTRPEQVITVELPAETVEPAEGLAIAH